MLFCGLRIADRNEMDFLAFSGATSDSQASYAQKSIMPRCFVLAAVFVCLFAPAEAFKPVPRRHALRIGAAALVAPSFAQPAFAKSKRTISIAEAEAQAKADIAAQTGLAAGSRGKGLRGTGNEDFDKNDTVQFNRDKYGGLAYDEKGRKKASGTRGRTAEDLGLKQWGC